MREERDGMGAEMHGGRVSLSPSLELSGHQPRAPSLGVHCCTDSRAHRLAQFAAEKRQLSFAHSALDAEPDSLLLSPQPQSRKLKV